MKVFVAPAPESTMPIFVFHVPEALRGSGLTNLLFDIPSRFDAYAGGGQCADVTYGPAKRGVGDGAPGPRPTHAAMVTDPYGAFWVFYYDSRGQTLRQVNFETGAVRSLNWDDEGNLVGVEDPLRGRTCLSYNDSGYTTEMVSIPVPDALGSQVPIRQRMAYTAAPVRVSAVFDPRQPAMALRTFDYDAQGNLRRIVDASGDTTDFTPTAWGDVLTIESFDGAVTIFDYDMSAGTVERVRRDAYGPAPEIVEVQFDRAGRPLNAVGALGASQEWTYLGGRLIGTRTLGGALDVATTISHDDDGRPVGAVVAGEVAVERVYDPLNHLQRVSEVPVDLSAPPRSTCARRGPDGRLLEMVGPDGRRLVLGYDGEGRVISVALGALAADPSATWDDGCPSAFTGDGQAVGGVIEQVEYDLAGRPTRVIDARGFATTIAYDGFGRPIKVTDARGAIARMGYDAMGNVTWRATYGAAAANLAYGPPVKSDPGLMAAVELTYDVLGRVKIVDRWHFDETGAWVGDGHAVTTYVYDTLDRRVRVVDDAGHTTTMEVDGAGRHAATYFATGDSIKVEYGDGGRRVTSSMTTPGGVVMRTAFLTPSGGARSRRHQLERRAVRDRWSRRTRPRRPADALDGGVRCAGRPRIRRLRPTERSDVAARRWCVHLCCVRLVRGGSPAGPHERGDRGAAGDDFVCLRRAGPTGAQGRSDGDHGHVHLRRIERPRRHAHRWPRGHLRLHVPADRAARRGVGRPACGSRVAPADLRV
jgi:YD repeat-containing protein